MIYVKQGMLDFFVKPVMNTGSIGTKDIITLINTNVNVAQELGIQYLFFV